MYLHQPKRQRQRQPKRQRQRLVRGNIIYLLNRQLIISSQAQPQRQTSLSNKRKYYLFINHSLVKPTSKLNISVMFQTSLFINQTHEQLITL